VQGPYMQVGYTIFLVWLQDCTTMTEDQVYKMGVEYSNRVFVGNLHTKSKMSEYDVNYVLRDYNYYPDDIKVIRDINGCSKGYCFVDFKHEDDSERLKSRVYNYTPPHARA
jgi:hypothetical protein